MKNCLHKDIRIFSSMCDAEGKLGIRNIFDLFMDLASEHAEMLDVGYYEMLERRCYWVAVRTRVKIYERPLLGSHITALTWPGKPGLAKSDRFYRIGAGNNIFAEGRTEWAAQDIDTGMVRRTASFGYPMDMEYRNEKVCEEGYTRFKNLEITSDVRSFPYTVGSMDIDVGKHMNNVAYVRAMLGTFSTSELAAMNITEMEVSYRRGCYEGETLSIHRVKTDFGWMFQVDRPDGEAALHGLIKTE